MYKAQDSKQIKERLLKLDFARGIMVLFRVLGFSVSMHTKKTSPNTLGFRKGVYKDTYFVHICVCTQH